MDVGYEIIITYHAKARNAIFAENLKNFVKHAYASNVCRKQVKKKEKKKKRERYQMIGMMMCKKQKRHYLSYYLSSIIIKMSHVRS